MMGFIKGFKSGFMQFGHNITVIINSILLTFVYIFGVGFSIILVKLIKKKFLELRLGKTSYWSDLNLEKQNEEYYFRQF